jgi:hypothetical protein
VFYLGRVVSAESRFVCAFYDLTMSVTHEAPLMLGVQCPVKDKTPSMKSIPHKITDRDLQNGQFTFDKMVKLHHPEDFKGFSSEHAAAYADDRYAVKGALQEAAIIELSQNFDLRASVEFEYDQAMYALRLDELTRD